MPNLINILTLPEFFILQWHFLHANVYLIIRGRVFSISLMDQLAKNVGSAPREIQIHVSGGKSWTREIEILTVLGILCYVRT
jgi:hypothetical protein